MMLADAPLIFIEVDRSAEASESCLATTSPVTPQAPSTSQCLEVLGANTLEKMQTRAEIQDETLECKASKIMQQRQDIQKLADANALESFAIQEKTSGKKMSKIIQNPVGIRNLTGQIFTCDKCGKSFGRKNHLTRHKKVHANLRPYTCDVCKKGFNYKQGLDIHLRIHTGQRPYPCSHCGKLFNERSSLRIHQRYHTGEKPYTCEECGESYVSATLLKSHKDIHGNPYPCFTCNRTFTRERYLKWHEQHHHQGADVEIRPLTRHKGTCNICGEKNVELAHHLIKKHSVKREKNGEQATYECLLCGKSYFFRSSLSSHLQSHASRKDFQCDKCGRLFLCKRNLQKHQDNSICERKRLKELKISCVDCGELFIKPDLKKSKQKSLLRCEKCKSVSYSCSICSRCGVSMTKGTKHRCGMLKKSRFNICCDVCKKLLYSEYYRTRHSCSSKSVSDMVRDTKEEVTPEIVLIKEELDDHAGLKDIYSEYHRTRHSRTSQSVSDMVRDTKEEVSPEIVLIKEEVDDTAALKDVFTFKIKDSSISIHRKDKENEEVNLTYLRH